MVWAVASLIVSAVWLYKPKLTRKFSWTLDFVMALGWAAIVGLLIDAFNAECPFAEVKDISQFCGWWKAVQAISLVNIALWIATGLLQIRFTGGRGGGRGGGGGGGGYV